jgi:hypothetical protein
MYLTGAYPSHLRRKYMALLRSATSLANRPTSRDGTSGNINLDPEVVSRLELEKHSMVREVDRLERFAHQFAGSA